MEHFWWHVKYGCIVSAAEAFPSRLPLTPPEGGFLSNSTMVSFLTIPLLYHLIHFIVCVACSDLSRLLVRTVGSSSSKTIIINWRHPRWYTVVSHGFAWLVAFFWNARSMRKLHCGLLRFESVDFYLLMNTRWFSLLNTKSTAYFQNSNRGCFKSYVFISKPFCVIRYFLKGNFIIKKKNKIHKKNEWKFWFFSFWKEDWNFNYKLSLFKTKV